MKVSVPGIEHPIGAGDIAKKITTAVGIKPCGGCRKRAEFLNNHLQFIPTIPVQKIEAAVNTNDEILIKIHELGGVTTVTTKDKQDNQWSYHWIDGRLKDRINA